jgi:hypothetical protein
MYFVLHISAVITCIAMYVHNKQCWLVGDHFVVVIYIYIYIGAGVAQAV